MLIKAQGPAVMFVQQGLASLAKFTSNFTIKIQKDHIITQWEIPIENFTNIFLRIWYWKLNFDKFLVTISSENLSWDFHQCKWGFKSCSKISRYAPCRWWLHRIREWHFQFYGMLMKTFRDSTRRLKIATKPVLLSSYIFPSRIKNVLDTCTKWGR